MTPEQIKLAEQIKLRDEWRALNIKLKAELRARKVNEAAGIVYSEEYLQWMDALKKRRDELTPLI